MRKGRALEKLKGKIESAEILPLINLNFHEFSNEWEQSIQKIQTLFPQQTIIIRSSSIFEDTSEYSSAGKFLSVPDVSSANSTLVKTAINSVFLSYGNNNQSNDEVLIQPMLHDILICGVAFTADQDTLAPYFIINYDTTGTFDGVTSGNSNTLETYVHYKNYMHNAPTPYLDKVLRLCRELEIKLNNKFLDIEFALTKDGSIFLLQSRPLISKSKCNFSKLNYDLCLERVFKKIKKINSDHPNLIGKRSYLGVMPDWNPAEIIGFRPKNLSLSLYQELITDSVWAYQRNNYGYRNLRSHPLMLSLMGIPYIDLRTSFNSFIPNNLSNDTASKLCNFYLDQLLNNPKTHDKVEFDIVFSCFHFSLYKNFKTLEKNNFSKGEINKIWISLLNLTNNILDLKNGLFINDLKKIERLKILEQKILNSDLPLIDKIYWLLEYIKRYGTLPFAGVARAAFIAVQITQSLVNEGIISTAEYSKFFNSLNTIPKKLNQDLNNVNKGKLSQTDFLKLYGHLRPGTYDITAQRYDENFSIYFDLSNPLKTIKETKFKFSKSQLMKIDNLLKKTKLGTNSLDLIKFIKMSIEGREYTKFVFTKTISECLGLIEKLGQKFNLSKEDMSHLDIKLIKNAYANLSMDALPNSFIENIKINKELHSYTGALKLPSLILEPENVYSFFIENEEPNFITLKNVTAPISLEDDGFDNIIGKIIFIRAADPGYDFLFSKNIVGLVTQFGGANSHMAIRCAELGIPAVIGAGEKLFNIWSKNRLIKIDCSLKQVYSIS